MAKPKKESLTFEDAFQKLESIVEHLEKGESTLEEAMKAFEKGMDLINICMAKLNDAEKRMKKLLKREDGSYQEEFME
ncbi:exodeoxyribonuclease VII small subunit [bacterium]|nr:exodeoxyribonuclease VII small subunit [bacterium]RQV96355.1 MAG: exodeoxyribonuclease VII small subunit [bacterium]